MVGALLRVFFYMTAVFFVFSDESIYEVIIPPKVVSIIIYDAQYN